MKKKVYVEIVPKEVVEEIAKTIGSHSAAASCLNDMPKYKNPVFFRWQGLLGICDSSDIKIEG